MIPNALSLILAATLCVTVGSAQAIEPGSPAYSTIAEQAFGKVTVREKVRPGTTAAASASPPRMELQWTSDDGAVVIELIDTGKNLNLGARGKGASALLSYQDYEEDGAYGIWPSAERAMQMLLSVAVMPAFTPEEKIAYTAQLVRSKADFAAALAHLKQRAAAVHGASLRRCGPPQWYRLMPYRPERVCQESFPMIVAPPR